MVDWHEAGRKAAAKRKHRAADKKATDRRSKRFVPTRVEIGTFEELLQLDPEEVLEIRVLTEEEQATFLLSLEPATTLVQ